MKKYLFLLVIFSANHFYDFPIGSIANEDFFKSLFFPGP
jgi:hypothetical protein